MAAGWEYTAPPLVVVGLAVVPAAVGGPDTLERVDDRADAVVEQAREVQVPEGLEERVARRGEPPVVPGEVRSSTTTCWAGDGFGSPSRGRSQVGRQPRQAPRIRLHGCRRAGSAGTSEPPSS